jgi:hypothetical protein
MFALCEIDEASSFPIVRTKALVIWFVMCEPRSMEKSALTKWREDRGLSLDDAAVQFGIKSKGYLSEIERGSRCSVAVALEIERVTHGEILAASLNPDVALVEKARRAAA